MSGAALGALEFNRYFALLRDAFPAQADYCVTDVSANVMAVDGQSQIIVTDQSDKLMNPETLHACKDLRELSVIEQGSVVYFSMAICAPTDERVGSLTAVMKADETTANEHFQKRVKRSLSMVVSCIEKEYRLTVELDAMAHELAGRYEELNLVYDNDDEELGKDVETFDKIVKDYVDYLGVDLVALVFPDQERIFCATGQEDPVLSPYDIIHQVVGKYMPLARADGQCLLVNDFKDSMGDELGLGIPYKALGCPVRSSKGNVEGILLCLNHFHRTDFYNSDRNLLTVMARKVAKVLQANFDSLTGLCNQQVFNRIVDMAVTSATNDGLFHCLLNIDLVQLGVMNDNLGRETGDAVIHNVGRIIRRKLRNTDTVAYLGEGRFGVLLEHCHLGQGEKVAELLQEQIDNTPLTRGKQAIGMGIAVGIALIEPHTRSLDDVLEASEIARQSAKKRTFKRIHAFRQDDMDLADRKQRMQWVSRIQCALRENKFRVFCQTISPVDVTDEAYHFEILLRLTDEQGKIVSPAEFMPPAEQFKLMPMIDRWVIDATLDTLSAAGYAQRAGEGMVCINLSGQSLSDETLAGYISDKMTEYGIDPACLCFEITETVAFSDNDEALCTMSGIKSLGCSLSLDDFGTGMSSFAYLKDLPVDYLKIDGSFVRAILDDKISHAMVTSINHIGHVMNLKTIAEFVENDALRERLSLMGIDYLQGYNIAKPVPLDGYLAGLETAAPLRPEPAEESG